MKHSGLITGLIVGLTLGLILSGIAFAHVMRFKIDELHLIMPGGDAQVFRYKPDAYGELTIDKRVATLNLVPLPTRHQQDL